jgi:hypothetical protein
LALYATMRLTTPIPTTPMLTLANRLVVVSTTGWARRGIPLLNLRIGDALARATSSRTGRACDVDEVDPNDRVIAQAEYDAVAIMISVTDSMSAAPLPGWQHAFRAALDAILPTIASGTPILVGVPVTRPTAASHTLRARLAERRRYRFTTEVATILNSYGRGELVALPLMAENSARVAGSPGVRERLADALADRLAPRLLQAGHDAAARRFQLTA